MLVVDASAAVALALSRAGLAALGDDLAAPALLLSEATSVVHGLAARREITNELADQGHAGLLSAPIHYHHSDELYRSARAVARRLGWTKTSDAEYVALARLLGVALVTRDLRLQRGAGHVVEIVTPDEVAG